MLFNWGGGGGGRDTHYMGRDVHQSQFKGMGEAWIIYCHGTRLMRKRSLGNIRFIGELFNINSGYSDNLEA